MKFKSVFLIAVISAPALSATQADHLSVTAEERCHYLADYASDVAIMRDMGIPKSEVDEVSSEKFRNTILEAHLMVSDMTYRNPQFSPEVMRSQLLKGCLQSVSAHIQNKK